MYQFSNLKIQNKYNEVQSLCRVSLKEEQSSKEKTIAETI